MKKTYNAKGNVSAEIPNSVVERITEIQEQSWWELIDLLKLKTTPLELRDQVVSAVLTQGLFSKQDLEKLEAQKLYTQLESPWSHLQMSIHTKILHRYFDANGLWSGKVPLTATLPTGYIDAMIVNVENDYPVIFFDQGLYPFIYNFAHIICWTVPPLTQDVTNDPRILRQLTENHEVRPEAYYHLEKTLFEYVVEGLPVFAYKKVPVPEFNKELAILLVNLMELFILAHEHAHVSLGHHKRSPSKQFEFEADAEALKTICAVALRECGFQVLGYWAADLVFSALTMFYTTMGLMTFGDVKLDWHNKIHPHPTEREMNLYKAFINMPTVSQTDVQVADGLLNLWHQSVDIMWQFISRVAVNSGADGYRPSPKWSQTIKLSMRATEIPN